LPGREVLADFLDQRKRFSDLLPGRIRVVFLNLGIALKAEEISSIAWDDFAQDQARGRQGRESRKIEFSYGVIPEQFFGMEGCNPL
jgi:hypothetical protein